mmetsp:Transcript_4043/g.11427  ORF Transcript_4043/g.11427 Transcript_4043/m.11427 type:complete len:351 (+) Transcript_4043:498-1550(+)
MTSARPCFTWTRSSASLAPLLSFVSSCWTELTRFCSLPSSDPDPDTEPDNASFFSSAVAPSKLFRQATWLAWATRSADLACSSASVRVSLSGSPMPPTAASPLATSFSLATSASEAAIFASTSSSRWVRLRSAREDLNCVRRSRPSSSRFCNMSTSSLTVLPGPSAKRATSANFRATKACASARAVWTFAATTSADEISSPMFKPLCSLRRKGNSASAMCWSSSSAAATLSDTSLSRLSAATRIWLSFTALRTSSSFCCASRHLSLSGSSLPLMGPGLVSTLRSLESMRRVVCAKPDWAALSAASVSLIPSALSGPSDAVIIAAFSTSISAAVSLLLISSSSFLACTLCS